jgi:steroid delta-isomerase-like uncharacterized protein
MSEKNLALARAAYAALCDSQDLTIANRAVDQYFDADFVGIGPSFGVGPDVEGSKQWNAEILEAFPDYSVTIEDQFASDDKVITRWTARGTHKGYFQGIAPQGKEVEVPGITISRYIDGKIVESWFEWDRQDLMQQLRAGAPPSDDDGWQVTGQFKLNITKNS